MRKMTTVPSIAALLIGCSVGFFRMPVLQAQVCGQERGYITLHGQDTVAIERIAFAGRTFSSRALGQGGLVGYTGRVNERGLVETLQAQIWRSAKDSLHAPDQQAEVVFKADEIIASVRTADGVTQSQTYQVASGSYPYVLNSLIFLEIMGRSLMGSRPTPASIGVTWLFTKGRHDQVNITKTGSSLLLRFVDDSLTMKLDTNGALVEVQRGGKFVTHQIPCAKP